MKIEHEKAIEIIKNGGKLISRNLRFTREVTEKSFSNFATDIDYKVERLVIKQLQYLIPNSSIITEETSDKIIPAKDYVWVLDPVDGTTNLIHKYPHIVISLALVYKGEIVFGSIYNPFSKELFFAEKNGGAYINNRRISVSANNSLDKSIIGFGLPYDRSKTGEIFSRAQKIFGLCQDIKRTGPAALDIAYVACGRLDAYFEMDLHPWDFSAGKIILEEAGGKVTQWNGDKLLYNDKNNILATNGYIHDYVKEELI